MQAMRTAMLLVVMALLLPGCSASAPITYFRLAPPERPNAADFNATPSLLGVWPVVLPDELERNEVVSYGSDAEVLVAGRHFWAGSLQDNVDRYLALALQRELDQPVLRYPWEGRVRPPQQLRVRLVQLGGKLGDHAVIDAEWSLVVDAAGTSRLRGQYRSSSALADERYQTYIAGLRKELDQLALAIAQSLREAPDGY